MPQIRILVSGAAGKMGQAVIAAVAAEPDMLLVGGLDEQAAIKSIPLPGGRSMPLFTDTVEALDKTKPNVVIDFSTAKAVLPLARAVFGRGIHMVSGTTGLTQDDLGEIDKLAKAGRAGAFVASNFAIGAIVMMHLAKTAARYFDYAEIIEEHHQTKIDAPSGTALTTAQMMAAERGKPFITPAHLGEQPSRGLEKTGISIHSVRIPGIVARQEVIFGAAGQTLSIRHEAISRECYMPGVILAAREVAKHTGLVFGLDKLLSL